MSARDGMRGAEPSDLIGGATDNRLPVDDAFQHAMRGKQYGAEETRDARAWFSAGWTAAIGSDPKPRATAQAEALALALNLSATTILATIASIQRRPDDTERRVYALGMLTEIADEMCEVVKRSGVQL